MLLCALPPDMVVRKAKNRVATDSAATGAESAAEIELKPDPAGPLVAQVFKTRIDPFVQKLNFIRVYSGTLKKDSSLPLIGARKPIKIAQLFHMQANESEPFDEAGPGEIVAVAKVEELHTGGTLGELMMPDIAFPRRWSAWPPGRRAVATKESYQAH